MTIIFSITILLFIAYTVLLVYYRMAWQQIPTPPPPAAAPTTSVTVIIPARNEGAAIGNCLNAIVNQQYPAHLLQVIVADDFSTDDTAEIVRSFANKNVTLLSLADFVTSPLNSYKKKAIELAIARSTGQLIVTTDADCIAPPLWLATIVSFYEKHHPAFIAAPVCINCSNRAIEIFQALDFMTLQGITGASVYKKFHSMCNGANLAYERSAFEAVDGFKNIDHIASGDDMLLMYKIFERHPQRVLFIKSKDAIVQTSPVHTVKQFFNQRIRWASKADKYTDKRIFPVLLLVYLLNVLLLVIPITAMFTHSSFAIPNPEVRVTNLECWLILLLLKIITELFFLYPVAKFFNKTILLWWFPLAQPFHICYTVIAGWLGKFGQYKWKGRSVK
jgi:cellulose synthase/poly-beta-1,6-N-acetylglucosamine synthase-like glycosyltransferase